MTDPTFGVIVRRTSSDTLPAIVADLSVFCLIGPADTADPLLYPLDEPVLVFSNDPIMATALGNDGFLKDGLRGINGQLAVAQRAATGVIIRTARGTNPDAAIRNQETIGNIIGDSAQRSGMYAALLAPEILGITPRLFAVPGYTGLLSTGVDRLILKKAGAGYVPGQRVELTFSGGGANAIQGNGFAIPDEQGRIIQSGLFVETSGAWYGGDPITVTVQGPAPTGNGAVVLEATAHTQQLANPICAALPVVLNQLLAHAVVESAGISVTQTQAWRETLNSERLIPVNGGVKVAEVGTGAIVVRPFASRVIGIGIRRDYEKGAPFHSWANQPIYDIVGPAQGLSFSMQDGSNEGQFLLSTGVGVITKGETGNDFALSDGGFTYVGTDNCSDDPDWSFYHVSRGRDYLNLAAVRVVRTFLGRNNIDAQTVTSMVNTLRFMLRDFKASGHILGYDVGFSGQDNSRASILQGRLKLKFRAEEPPVLRRVELLSGRMHEAVDALVADLENSLALAA